MQFVIEICNLQGRGERYALGSVSKFRRDDGCALYHVHACRESGGGKDEVEGEVSKQAWFDIDYHFTRGLDYVDGRCLFARYTRFG